VTRAFSYSSTGNSAPSCCASRPCGVCVVARQLFADTGRAGARLNLNAGKVSLNGAFPNLSANLDFTVEYISEFDGAGGKNILFNYEKTSDDAGYVIAVQLVAAS
jgi:hypothetical protein